VSDLRGSLRRAAPTLAILALLALAVWSSVRTVARDEQGVVLRFGLVSGVEPPGIHMGLPWPFEKVERVKSTEVRTMSVGFKLVDAARGVPPTADEVQWLTADRNIVELRAAVLYTVRDPVEYLFGSATRDGAPSRDFAIRTAAESVLTAMLAQMPIDDVFAAGKTRLQLDPIERVQALVDEMHLGVGIRGMNIIEARAPAVVISAFDDVQIARADRERSISEAAGYAARVLPEARAQADRVVREAEIYRSQTIESARGEADMFRKLAAEVEKHPEIGRRRLRLDLASRIRVRGQKIIVATAQAGQRQSVFLGG